MASDGGDLVGRAAGFGEAPGQHAVANVLAADANDVAAPLRIERPGCGLAQAVEDATLRQAGLIAPGSKLVAEAIGAVACRLWWSGR
jgi:hypothetical protein